MLHPHLFDAIYLVNDPIPIIEGKDSDIFSCSITWKRNDIPHRENEPAIIIFNINRTLYSEKYMLYNYHHRDNKIAYWSYHNNGHVYLAYFAFNDTKYYPHIGWFNERWNENGNIQTQVEVTSNGYHSVDYYASGTKHRECYYINPSNLDISYHRDATIGPAYIGYYPTGSIRVIKYMERGVYHRIDKAAYKKYYADGSVRKKYYEYGIRLKK
jgi:hypothetical protein